MSTADINRSIARWWSNLKNALESLHDEGLIEGDTTIAELLEKIDNKCEHCGRPVTFHEEECS